MNSIAVLPSQTPLFLAEAAKNPLQRLKRTRAIELNRKKDRLKAKLVDEANRAALRAKLDRRDQQIRERLREAERERRLRVEENIRSAVLEKKAAQELMDKEIQKQRTQHRHHSLVLAQKEEDKEETEKARRLLSIRRDLGRRLYIASLREQSAALSEKKALQIQDRLRRKGEAARQKARQNTEQVATLIAERMGTSQLKAQQTKLTLAAAEFDIDEYLEGRWEEIEQRREAARGRILQKLATRRTLRGATKPDLSKQETDVKEEEVEGLSPRLKMLLTKRSTGVFSIPESEDRNKRASNESGEAKRNEGGEGEEDRGDRKSKVPPLPEVGHLAKRSSILKEAAPRSVEEQRPRGTAALEKVLRKEETFKNTIASVLSARSEKLQNQKSLRERRTLSALKKKHENVSGAQRRSKERIELKSGVKKEILEVTLRERKLLLKEMEKADRAFLAQSREMDRLYQHSLTNKKVKTAVKMLENIAPPIPEDEKKEKERRGIVDKAPKSMKFDSAEGLARSLRQLRSSESVGEEKINWGLQAPGSPKLRRSGRAPHSARVDASKDKRVECGLCLKKFVGTRNLQGLTNWAAIQNIRRRWEAVHHIVPSSPPPLITGASLYDRVRVCVMCMQHVVEFHSLKAQELWKEQEPQRQKEKERLAKKAQKKKSDSPSRSKLSLDSQRSSRTLRSPRSPVTPRQ